MKGIMKREHFKRYKDVAWLLWKYGRSDLVKQAGLDKRLAESEKPREEADPTAANLAADLERLGPTYVKLGQLLSTQAQLLPPAYIEALAHLQDEVSPFAFEEVERIVAAELGGPIGEVFGEFEREPLAAASLGQVHHAVLRDGREVAVKVQRPGIRKMIVADFEAFEHVARWLDRHYEGRYDAAATLDELRRTILAELDYHQEADHLRTIGQNLRDFESLVVPQPILDYTTERVLTMQYIRGTKVTAMSRLRRLEIDGAALANELCRAYLQQILVDGLFHADPHPGNVFLTEDKRLALLDLGMVGRVTPRLQEELLQLVMALSEGRGEDAAELALRIGRTEATIDRTRFIREVATVVAVQKDASLERVQFGRLMLDVARMCGALGVRVPQQITMIGKTLLNLDRVGQTLDPKFNPDAAIRDNVVTIMRRQVLRAASPAMLLEKFFETKRFAEQLPGRLNDLLDALAHNRLGLHIDAIDEARLIRGIQKVANRITVGLILASLIVGAAMLMRVETEFQIFGYPGFAILLFVAAAAGGVWLMVTILLSDE